MKYYEKFRTRVLRNSLKLREGINKSKENFSLLNSGEKTAYCGLKKINYFIKIY